MRMSSDKDETAGHEGAHPQTPDAVRRPQENDTGEAMPNHSLRKDMGLLYTARSDRRRNSGSKIQALHLM